MRVRSWVSRSLVMWSLVPGLSAVAAGAELRELQTDRPDTTEGPFTVDAGHWQFEMSLAEWTRDRTDSVTRESWALAPFNVRYGVTDAIEVDWIAEPYDRARVSAAGGAGAASGGFGDTVLRLKWNLWGNDAGRTAFALLPYVKLPTAGRAVGNGHVEGGLVLPMAWRLGAAGDLSAMVVVDLPRNQANDGYAPDIVHSASYSHDLPGACNGYVEVAGFWSPSHDQDYRGYFDAGVTRGLGANAQIDAGVRVGMTRAADDFAAFVGLAWRY